MFRVLSIASQMTERIIQEKLKYYFANYDYKLFNAFIYAWESDFFGISKSGYALEVEVKISRADFRKDFQCKTEKHHLLTNFKKSAILERKWPFKPYLRKGETEYHYREGDASSIWFCNPADKLPNKFYYCVPEGLISVNDIPETGQ